MIRDNTSNEQRYKGCVRFPNATREPKAVARMRRVKARPKSLWGGRSVFVHPRHSPVSCRLLAESRPSCSRAPAPAHPRSGPRSQQNHCLAMGGLGARCPGKPQAERTVVWLSGKGAQAGTAARCRPRGHCVLSRGQLQACSGDEAVLIPLGF